MLIHLFMIKPSASARVKMSVVSTIPQNCDYLKKVQHKNYNLGHLWQPAVSIGTCGTKIHHLIH
jgi:hypothetical protein